MLVAFDAQPPELVKQKDLAGCPLVSPELPPEQRVVHLVEPVSPLLGLPPPPPGSQEGEGVGGVTLVIPVGFIKNVYISELPGKR